MGYICVRQQNLKDCGVACLSTIFKNYGLSVPLNNLRDLANTDRMGTTAYGIVKAAQSYNFNTKVIRSTNKDFIPEIPLPAIAHLIVDNYEHYVVIYKITSQNVTIADPLRGITQLTYEMFLQQWTGILILMLPNEDFQKGKYDKLNYKFLISQTFNNKKQAMTLLVLSISLAFLSIIGAFYIGFLIDYVMKKQEFNVLNIVFLGFALINVLTVLLTFLRNDLLFRFEKNVSYNLLTEYFTHMLKLPLSYFDKKTSGEIFSIVLDIEKIKTSFTTIIFTLFFDVFVILMSGIILYIQNKNLFLYTLLLLPFYVIIALGFQNRFIKAQEKVIKEQTDLSSEMYENINGIEVIKSYNLENTMYSKIDNRINKYTNSYKSINNLYNKQVTLKDFVTNIGQFILLGIGIFQVKSGNLSLGNLMSFNTLMVLFTFPIQNILLLNYNLQITKESFRKIQDTLSIEKENHLTKYVGDFTNGDIHIKELNYSFGYRNPALINIHSHIECGSKVAIVGPSGSGKSTLVKLLMNFYSTYQGNIYINNTDINCVSIEELRRNITYVPQNSYFFNDTIINNLALSFDINSISEDALKNILKLTNCDTFIQELPLGLDTVLEENAFNLSTGQKQRLAIARALLNPNQILILDEATSNLDINNEKNIISNIRNCSSNTLIVVTHRLSSMKEFDKIIVMDKGEIVGEGSHDHLLEKNLIYRKLWYKQEEDNQTELQFNR
ncbi:peptidase domain-containing ABC transporter [Priestia megaterium]|uniref:peptidase domain-containing ABC transporter n=1 Tax=Priestia megaterium TaxID=1404 RepID=UPI003BA22D7F